MAGWGALATAWVLRAARVDTAHDGAAVAAGALGALGMVGGDLEVGVRDIVGGGEVWAPGGVAATRMGGGWAARERSGGGGLIQGDGVPTDGQGSAGERRQVESATSSTSCHGGTDAVLGVGGTGGRRAAQRVDAGSGNWGARWCTHWGKELSQGRDSSERR